MRERAGFAKIPKTLFGNMNGDMFAAICRYLSLFVDFFAKKNGTCD
jgi:hypothetical protein